MSLSFGSAALATFCTNYLAALLAAFPASRIFGSAAFLTFFAMSMTKSSPSSIALRVAFLIFRFIRFVFTKKLLVLADRSKAQAGVIIGDNLLAAGTESLFAGDFFAVVPAARTLLSPGGCHGNPDRPDAFEIHHLALWLAGLHIDVRDDENLGQVDVHPAEDPIESNVSGEDDVRLERLADLTRGPGAFQHPRRSFPEREHSSPRSQCGVVE